jgi:hypothetical protein
VNQESSLFKVTTAPKVQAPIFLKDSIRFQ